MEQRRVKMSRVVLFKEIGGPEKLEIVDKEVAAPGSGEVRMNVKAIGLNRAEAMWRSGQYLEDPKLPAQLGYEAAGTIDAVGSDVKDFKVGDVVSTMPNFSMNAYGVYGDTAVVPVSSLVKHSSSLTFEEASSIWMMFVTAYDGLIETAKLASGEFVLIPAASSSVGIAAIQIANMIGAVPVALTRTSEKSKQLLEAGAAHVIATEEQDLVAEVMKITGGKGAQVIYDPVGGATFAKLMEAAAQHGRLVMYGLLSPDATTLPLAPLIGKVLSVTGSMIMTTTADPAKMTKAIDWVNAGFKAGKLKPVIAKTFSLDQIVDAHRYLESNQQFGKIVVTV